MEAMMAHFLFFAANNQPIYEYDRIDDAYGFFRLSYRSAMKKALGKKVNVF